MEKEQAEKLRRFITSREWGELESLTGARIAEIDKAILRIAEEGREGWEKNIPALTTEKKFLQAFVARPKNAVNAYDQSIKKRRDP